MHGQTSGKGVSGVHIYTNTTIHEKVFCEHGSSVFSYTPALFSVTQQLMKNS